MRANTMIWIAMRNIGDAADQGDFFHGTLTECVFWQAKKLANLSIATRIVIGIGRHKEDAILAIDVKGASKGGVTQDMMSILESIMSDDSSGGGAETASAGPKIPEDSPVTRTSHITKQAEDDDYVA